jgi:cell division initiation protein
MNYTPNELENLKIPSSMKGYKTDFVDDLLEKILEDYTSFLRDNASLKEKVELLNEGVKHYKNLEESIKNTLVLAQQTGDEVKKAAHENAENIIKEAKIKARNIISDAENKAYEAKRSLEEMKKSLYTYKAKAGSVIKAQLELMDKIDEE